MPFFLSMKSSTIPESSGPGRNSATRATRSSNLSGLSRFISFLIPSDSNWNTAVVSIRRIVAYVSLSSRAMVLTSSFAAVLSSSLSLMSFSAQSIMVRVRKPRKSNLTRPMVSTSPMSNWVDVTVVFFSQYRGMNSVNARGEMTIPPACFPAFRTNPSSFFARSISILTSSSSAYRCFSISSSFSARSSVISSSNGINLAILSTKP